MKKLLTLASLAALAAATVLVLPTLAAPAAQTIRVTETEYRIALSARPKAGPVTFIVRNSGDDAHDLWVRGAGKTYRTKAVGSGSTSRLTVKLKRGVKYVYWCGVSDHAEEGMKGSFVAR